MAAVAITIDDLLPFAPNIDEGKAEAMIEDALALAARVAPCILEPAFEHEGAARAILRGAILRWNDSGSGAIVSQAAGPFSQTIDTSQVRRSMFWPSEIKDLQELCGRPNAAKAFSVDMAAAGGGAHAEACSLRFGADYCSCGVWLTRSFPLWET